MREYGLGEPFVITLYSKDFSGSEQLNLEIKDLEIIAIRSWIQTLPGDANYAYFKTWVLAGTQRGIFRATAKYGNPEYPSHNIIDIRII